MTTDPTNDDCLPDPAPPAPQIAQKAGRQAKVTPLRPIAGSLDDLPIAAGPAPRPGDGLDPPDVPPDAPPPRGSKPDRPRGQIWAGCPVKPLGTYGDVSWYLDITGQLRGVDNHQLQKMLHLFGGTKALNQLAAHFPQFDKDGAPKRGKFDQLALSAVMIGACAERGVWSPTGRVRGAGAWTDDAGQLVFHAGDAAWIEGEWRDPGVYDGKVYPASDPVPRPADKAAGDPAAEALALIETWRWRRPDVDAMLALGIVCAGMMGGALDWRPVSWLTGDAATGKSTFQRLMLLLHGGENGLLQAADATEAGIRSVVGYSSLPVAIDELEPDPDRPLKVKAVVELARRAASGGQVFRGSTDQKGHQSNASSAFLFSSILVPPMPAQDRSRLILLDLERFPEGSPKVTLDPRALRRIGAQLRRRLIDGWPTWAERLELWRGALAAHGQVGRGADNYATVLAMADMALRADLPSPSHLDGWAAKLGRAVTDESVEVGSNAEDMLVHLLSQPLDVYRRGQRFTVAQWVAMAARLPGAPEAIEGATDMNANDFLAPYGLRVRGREQDAELFIGNKPLAYLCTLFERSPWQDGGWAQAARRVPGAEPVNLTLNRVAMRGHYIPLARIPGFLSFPMDKGAAAAPGAPPAGGQMEDFV